jgi:lipopolysaccharide heptosyltransferase II
MKTYIGDAVMASPIIPVLEREFSEVQVLAAGVIDQVLWVPDRERRFLKMPRVRKLPEVLRQASELRKLRFDIAVMVNHSFRSALTAMLAGIPVRVGHTQEYRRITLTHPVPYGQDEFETTSCYNLLRRIGIDVPEDVPYLPVTEGERAEGLVRLEGATVGLQPGARFGQKQIPTDVAVAVAKALQREGHKVALLGGPEEADIAENVLRMLDPGAISLAGKTNIRGTLGALAGLGVMVGSDTGLMHMAAGVGCPTVTVFGPTPRKKWGHHYPPHTVLQAEGGLISNITPDEILSAARRALQGG